MFGKKYWVGLYKKVHLNWAGVLKTAGEAGNGVLTPTHDHTEGDLAMAL